MGRPTLSFLLRRQLHSSTLKMAPVAVGDKIPSVSLFKDSPGDKVDISALCAGKKFIIFGVPGAFTPGCSKTHLPGYVAHSEDLKGKGFKQIFCVSVNDPFVMAAWGENQNATGKVTMLADTCGDFTKAIDLELDLSKVLGNVRSKRFSIVVEDGKAVQVNVEPDGTGLTCSLAENLA